MSKTPARNIHNGAISIENRALIADDLTGLARETDVCWTTIDDPAPDKLNPAT